MDPAHQPHEGTHPTHGQPPASTEPELVPLRLVLQPGGASVEVNQADVLVGRHSEADIRLPLPDVSRRHCRLHYVEGCWQVVDLHSLNGVFVNGEQVLQAPLHDGDLLRIGGFTFTVELGREEEAVRSILQILDRHAAEPRRQAS